MVPVGHKKILSHPDGENGDAQENAEDGFGGSPGEAWARYGDDGGETNEKTKANGNGHRLVQRQEGYEHCERERVGYGGTPGRGQAKDNGRAPPYGLAT